jgi:hypothetical protein
MSNLPQKIVSSDYYRVDIQNQIKKEFQSNGYVKLPKFLTSEAFNTISSEVIRLYTKRVRKDFVMPSYNTDRKMSTISGKEVVRISDVIADFYASTELREIISSLIGNYIHTVRHEDEFLVVNFLDGERDTHGWHLDDPRYALIVIIESPSDDDGGNLEYVPDWNRFARKNNLDPIQNILEGLQIAKCGDIVKTDSLKSSDCYLLDAHDVLHRVSPMHGTGKRKALNLAFDDRQYRIYGDSATRLYA